MDASEPAMIFWPDSHGPSPSAEMETHRLLQEFQKGRTVLTILYLCVLGLCFSVPVFYYFRMFCEERHSRRMRDLEIAGMTEALEQSQNMYREESRAARKKYREERRARIVQLLSPVQVTLTEDHFPHLREGKAMLADATDAARIDPNSSSSSIIPQRKESISSDRAVANATPPPPTIATDQTVASMLPPPPTIVTDQAVASIPSDRVDQSHKSMDEDQLFIELPMPGFKFPSHTTAKQPSRFVSNMCTICLCNYTVGCRVVWSSNEACDHVFHDQCILQWLMKQREGPLCPCCRRDFVIDPYDMEEEDTDKMFTRTTAAATVGDMSDDETALAVAEFSVMGSSSLPAATTDALPPPEADLAALRMEEGVSSSNSSQASPLELPPSRRGRRMGEL